MQYSSAFRFILHLEPLERRALPSLHRMSPSRPEHPGIAPANLPRALGASRATVIVVGAIICGGIFLVLREMMQDAGASSLVFLAWFADGLLSLFGAYGKRFSLSQE